MLIRQRSTPCLSIHLRTQLLLRRIGPVSQVSTSTGSAPPTFKPHPLHQALAARLPTLLPLVRLPRTCSKGRSTLSLEKCRQVLFLARTSCARAAGLFRPEAGGFRRPGKFAAKRLSGIPSAGVFTRPPGLYDTGVLVGGVSHYAAARVRDLASVSCRAHATTELELIAFGESLQFFRALLVSFVDPFYTRSLPPFKGATRPRRSRISPNGPLSAVFADYLASFHLLVPQHITSADCALMLVNIESLKHYLDVYGSLPTVLGLGLG
jgi:hypothetical protein